MHKTSSVLVLVGAVLFGLGCDSSKAKSDGESSAKADSSAKATVAVGTKVKAPWSRTGTMYAGKVTELYGKLAHVDFDDGDKGWADVTKLDPPGPAQAAPGDACAVKPGMSVQAPWSRSKAMFSGKVSEVHGKLAHVDFNDGDKGWALCAEIKEGGAAAPPVAGVAAAVAVGAKVKAPWSRAGTMYSGKVTELYGKLAHIDFDDGDKGWADVTKLDPAGTALPTPTDPCAFKVDQKVKAPWSRAKTMYSGKIDELHGKLAHVSFDDGDKGWALCSEIK